MFQGRFETIRDQHFHKDYPPPPFAQPPPVARGMAQNPTATVARMTGIVEGSGAVDGAVVAPSPGRRDRRGRRALVLASVAAVAVTAGAAVAGALAGEPEPGAAERLAEVRSRVAEGQPYRFVAEAERVVRPGAGESAISAGAGPDGPR